MAAAQDGHADEVTGAEHGGTGGKAHEGGVAFREAVIQQGRIHRPKAGQGEKNGQPRHKFAGNGLFPEQSDQPRDPRSGHRGAQKGNEDIRKTKREQQGVKIQTARPGEIF